MQSDNLCGGRLAPRISEIPRRSLFGYLVGMFATFVGIAPGQTATLQNGKVKVCSDEILTCPVCKQKTCPNIDTQLLIPASANIDHPDFAILPTYHLERCENCHAAFFRE